MEMHFPRPLALTRFRKGKDGNGSGSGSGSGGEEEDFIPDNMVDRLILSGIPVVCSSFGVFVHQKLHHRPDLFTAW